MSPYIKSSEKMDLIVKNWQVLADRYNGKFGNIVSKFSAILDPVDNLYRRFELKLALDGEVFLFTSSENRYFKFECELKYAVDIQLEINREDLFEKVSKFLGMQDIELGNAEIDDKYIIKSNEPDFIQSLLDSKIQEYFLNISLYSLSVDSNAATKVMIMPYIHEDDVIEMENFIDFIRYFIRKLKGRYPDSDQYS